MLQTFQQIQQKSFQIVPIGTGMDNITSPDGALDHCRAIARRIVSLKLTETHTREIAVQALAREYRLGNFLASLLNNGKRPTVHLHLYTRLVRALAKEVQAQKIHIKHLEHTLEVINGGPAAGQDLDTQQMASLAPNQADRTGGQE